jgi:hypothetical protein
VGSEIVRLDVDQSRPPINAALQRRCLITLDDLLKAVSLAVFASPVTIQVRLLDKPGQRANPGKKEIKS